MPNDSFDFKQFTIKQDKCAMKVGTDAVLLGAWTNTDKATRVLDIGTGTGILALMLAQRCKALIDAIDIDSKAIEQATENVLNSPWSDRIKVQQTSLQQYAKSNTALFDLIISNPPYFIDSSKALDHERTLARHTDHLPYEELLHGVLLSLAPLGRFCLILPTKEGEQFIQMAQDNFLYLTKLTHVKTKLEKPEKRLLMQFEKSKQAIQENVLVIEEDHRHAYTEQFKSLTAPYYIHH